MQSKDEKIKNRYLKNVTYLDVRNGTWQGPTNILVQDGVIKRIGDEAAPEGVPVLDCTGLYVTPGLTDMHVHIIWAGETLDPVRTMLDDGAYKTILKGVFNAQSTLAKGITTIRDVGSMDDMDFDLAEIFEEGVLLGPNIVPCGRILQCTGGHVPDLGIIADSPDEIKRSIRYLKSRGGHWVKIAATGGAFGPEEIGPVLYDEQELQLIVDTAHSLNMKVCAHALSKVGIDQCIHTGVDCIEHGAVIDEAGMDMMIEKGLTYIPTLTIYRVLANSGDKLAANVVEKSIMVTAQQKETFQLALKKGVRIALGTDAGSVVFGPHPNVHNEMKMMHEYGMPIADVIKSATITPAEVLGDERIGSVDVGKRADLVGLRSNPLDSLDAFEEIEFVLKDGRRAV